MTRTAVLSALVLGPLPASAGAQGGFAFTAVDAQATLAAARISVPARTWCVFVAPYDDGVID
jgi:hypothetical protein